MGDYVYLLFFLFFGILFPLGGIVTERFLAPKKPDPIKETAYECGIETEGATWVQFNTRYYLYALIFLVFDVEAIFFFSWAVYFRNAVDAQLGLGMFVAMAIFLIILVVGFAYEWKRRALEWR